LNGTSQFSDPTVELAVGFFVSPSDWFDGGGLKQQRKENV
jgi:hypothetical protein